VTGKPKAMEIHCVSGKLQNISPVISIQYLMINVNEIPQNAE